MGVPSPPRSVSELAAEFDRFAPERTGSDHVREVRGFVLRPPLSAPALVGYTVLARAAENSLPSWAQSMLATPARAPAVRRADDLAARALLATLQVALVESPARAAARARLGISLDQTHTRRLGLFSPPAPAA